MGAGSQPQPTLRAAPEIDSRATAAPAPYGAALTWSPRRPRFRLLHILLTWLVTAAAVFLAAAIVPGVTVRTFGDALVAAALIGLLNAVILPFVAALRLPFALVLGFFLALALDAVVLLLASDIDASSIKVSSFGWALLAALVISALTLALDAILGIEDDDTYSLRVITRIARRQHNRRSTDVAGLVCLEIDGLASPVLQRAMRSGEAPNMARWLESGGYRLDEWETDLSSQTGASQAGILLGSNHNVPAFRWVEEGDRQGDDVLLGVRLHGDRAAPRGRPRAAYR